VSDESVCLVLCEREVCDVVVDVWSYPTSTHTSHT